MSTWSTIQEINFKYWSDDGATWRLMESLDSSEESAKISSLGTMNIFTDIHGYPSNGFSLD